MWPNLMAEFIKRNNSSLYNSSYQMNFGPKFIFGCLLYIYISVSTTLDELTDGEFV